ncbi:MAG: hypothetical protein ACYTF7_06800 [Planctomycetota bacterium]
MGQLHSGIEHESIQLGPEDLQLDRLVLIATGAHLRSEVGDRPIAYSLRQEILTRLEDRFPDGSPLDVVVCSDLWRLNDESLSQIPTVSIGGPGVNALTACLGDKLASVFVIEDRLIVQADLDFDDLTVCCWGMDHDLTISATQAFVEKYLDAYLDAIVRGVLDHEV